MPSQHQVARVAVDDDAWRAFRQAALVRGISVSSYLGKLVEAELKRRKDTALSRTDPDDPPPDIAMDALATVRASIDELDDVAGRLARMAVATGATWDEVGSTLRLDPAVARKAFCED